MLYSTFNVPNTVVGALPVTLSTTLSLGRPDGSELGCPLLLASVFLLMQAKITWLLFSH